MVQSVRNSHKSIFWETINKIWIGLETFSSFFRAFFDKIKEKLKT
jgi:hypothetical protein